MRSDFIFLLFACSLSSFTGYSQSVTIKGKADTSYLPETSSIYAYTYDDYISYKEKEMGKSKLGENGNFSMTFSITEPTYIFLTVDNAKAEMVCEPGKTYDLTFLARDSDAVNTLSIAIPAELEFNNSGPGELNYLMAEFSSLFSAFLEDTSTRVMIAGKSSDLAPRIEELQMLTLKKYAVHNNSYLNHYIKYTFAAMEESIALNGNDKIYKTYIDNQPILLGNHEYMSFFNQFYSHVVDKAMDNYLSSLELNKKNFSGLTIWFTQFKYLTNDTLREAVILKSLSRYLNYENTKTVHFNSILEILEQAAKQCKSPANKKSAEYLKKKLAVMAVGQPLSPMTFLNAAGKSVSLSDFKGKYLYLSFWTTWSVTSVQELAIISDLKKNYGSNMHFVSICLDKDPATFKNFVKKNPKFDPDKNASGFTLLYCDHYKKAKNEFNVLSVPAYYLIDPKGMVVLSPASNPVEIEPICIRIKKLKR